MFTTKVKQKKMYVFSKMSHSQCTLNKCTHAESHMRSEIPHKLEKENLCAKEVRHHIIHSKEVYGADFTH